MRHEHAGPGPAGSPLSIRRAFPQLVLDTLLLRRGTFSSIAGTPSLTGHAFLLVVLTAIAASASALTTEDSGLVAEVSTRVILSTAGWVLGTGVVSVVAAKILRPPMGKSVDRGKLARAFGFAHAPALLRVMGVVPEVAAGILVLSLCWQLVATAIATKEALGYHAYWKALAVLFIAFWPYAAIMYVLNLLF